MSGAFFSLLQTLSTQFRQAPEQAQDRQPWTYRLVQFADMLLSHSRNVVPLTPFTTQQRQAWDRMLKTLKELETHSSEAKAKATAFQHLLLLVGIHLFKSPAESCDLLGDIQTCIKKSLGEKTRRTRSKATNPQELPWVEVLVEILLSLLAQPSHLMRQVARSVFSHICSHLTPRALQLILDVLNPEESQDEDDNVVVTDDSKEEPLGEAEDKSSDDEDNKGDKNSESEEESDGEESDEAERDGDVDQGFREQLMAVLQAGKALGGGDGEDDDDEELGDEAMMALDENLASLFAEQKLRIQARREEKNKLQKEKALRRDFQIRVLDLIEVLVTKQPENPWSWSCSSRCCTSSGAACAPAAPSRSRTCCTRRPASSHTTCAAPGITAATWGTVWRQCMPSWSGWCGRPASRPTPPSPCTTSTPRSTCSGS